MSKRKCTYCGNEHVVAKMDTGALRSLGKRDYVLLCARCVKFMRSERECGCHG